MHPDDFAPSFVGSARTSTSCKSNTLVRKYRVFLPVQVMCEVRDFFMSVGKLNIQMKIISPRLYGLLEPP